MTTDQLSIKDWLTLACAIISLIISVSTFIFARVQERPKILVFPAAKPPFHSLVIEAVNNGNRPVTITSVRVVYGRASLLQDSQLVVQTSHGLPLKLSEGDLWVHTISKDALASGTQTKGVRQGYGNLLWVTVTAANGQVFFGRAQIDPSIITGQYYGPAQSILRRMFSSASHRCVLRTSSRLV